MTHQAFLQEFARVQGCGTVEDLLRDHAERYSFQISSRERAKSMISLLADRLPALDLRGAKVFDVGCAYGSYSIEMANRGAKVVGIDINDKWLKLADVNAAGEPCDVTFYKVDASSRTALKKIEPHGPFDLVVVNDVFEHIFDTPGLLANLRSTMKPGAFLYFKVPNGMATRSVISEGHKKKFGISLLAPDYWQMFVTAPFHIYYRRKAYFDALFHQFGFKTVIDIAQINDPDIETTRQHIRNDVRKIQQKLKRDNFEQPAQFACLKHACTGYFDEIADDLEHASWSDLYMKYRVTFWEAIMVA